MIFDRYLRSVKPGVSATSRCHIRITRLSRMVLDALQYGQLWFLVNLNISTYQTGSSMIAVGLSWWQALIAILVGDLLASSFAVLNSFSGATSHLGYPMVTRSVWGKFVVHISKQVSSWTDRFHRNVRCVLPDSQSNSSFGSLVRRSSRHWWQNDIHLSSSYLDGYRHENPQYVAAAHRDYHRAVCWLRSFQPAMLHFHLVQADSTTTLLSRCVGHCFRRPVLSPRMGSGYQQWIWISPSCQIHTLRPHPRMDHVPLHHGRHRQYFCWHSEPK